VTGPAVHNHLDRQVARVYAQYQRQPDNLAKNVLLTEIRPERVLFTGC
jgi:hypothetical protein